MSDYGARLLARGGYQVKIVGFVSICPEHGFAWMKLRITFHPCSLVR